MPTDSPQWTSKFARVIIWAYAVTAVLTFARFVIRPAYRAPTSWSEYLFYSLNLPLSDTLTASVVLTILAWTLVGRKRIGLWAAALTQIMGVVFSAMYLLFISSMTPAELTQLGLTSTDGLLTHIMSVASLAVGVSALIGMWCARKQFPGHIRRGSWLAALAIVAVGIVIAAINSYLLLSLFDQNPADNPAAVRDVLLAGAGLDSWDDAKLPGVPIWVPHIAGFTFVVFIAVALIVFLRSSHHDGEWSGDREVALRKLIAEYGEDDSLAYFATRRDKASVFSPDQRAAVTYSVIAGVSLASGDPVGDPKSWGKAIRSWAEEARYYGWTPAVLGASERGGRAYVTYAGLTAFSLGDEAVLIPEHFTKNTTSLVEVKRTANKLEREGFSVNVSRLKDLPEKMRDNLHQNAEAWRVGGTERGYSMALNRSNDPADSNNVVVEAVDATGAPVGLLTFVPWGRHGLSLDLMRRSPKAPNGINELMVTSLINRSADLGITRVSLNFAMLRGIYVQADKLGATPLTKLNSSVLKGFDRFFQLERLYRATEKYAPTWNPRYLCADGYLALPQTSVAAGMAEGFLPRIRLGVTSRSLADEQLEEVHQIGMLDENDIEELTQVRGSDQTAVRLRHLTDLRAIGKNPAAVGSRDTQPISQLLTEPERWNAQNPDHVTCHGRVRTTRHHGGVLFLDLVADGKKLQLIAERNTLGQESLTALRRLVDRGDILVVTGIPTSSHTGTQSVSVQEWNVAAKALHPLPFESFTDGEARLRRRSTDLIVNPNELATLRVRSAVVTQLRSTLCAAGLSEVETPILHTVHGGASARPFTTHINAYNVGLSLRIAPELYLKRLIVGGFGGVFEMGRNFRNEGVDATHNPEFTAMEAYIPFADYTTMRELTERLVKEASAAVYGTPQLPLPVAPGSNERVLTDISGPWPVRTVCDAVSEAVGQPIGLDTDFEVLLSLCEKHDIAVHTAMGPGALIEELYAELVEESTIFPTFYTDFPVETSPLAGAHRSTPGLAERWDVVVAGMELGTAYSELTDPLDQRRRLTEQSLKAAAGDPEAMSIDHDFLHALEVGMPPTGGLGLGVDRLVMAITGTNIRSVLTFPFARPAQR